MGNAVKKTRCLRSSLLSNFDKFAPWMRRATPLPRVLVIHKDVRSGVALSARRESQVFGFHRGEARNTRRSKLAGGRPEDGIPPPVPVLNSASYGTHSRLARRREIGPPSNHNTNIHMRISREYFSARARAQSSFARTKARERAAVGRAVTRGPSWKRDGTIENKGPRARALACYESSVRGSYSRARLVTNYGN